MLQPEARIWLEKKSILAKETLLLLHKIGAIKFGQFTLTSGRVSPHYIDLRLLPSYPEALDKIGSMYAELITNELRGEEKVDSIVGVATSGLPIATVVSQKMRIPLIYVRKEARDHGTGKRIEGSFAKGNSVILVDDVITTGGSSVTDAAILRDEGINVKNVFVLIDREEGGAERLQASGLILHRLVGMKELLTHLVNLELIDKETYRNALRYIEYSKLDMRVEQ